MARRLLVLLAALSIPLALSPVASGATPRGELWPGVTLTQTMQLTGFGPVVLHVLTGPRPDGVTSLDLLLSNDSVLGRETVSSMQRRVADGVVAGINGDFSRFDNGKLSGMFMRNGELAVAPNPNRSSAGMLADGTLEVRRAALRGTWRATDGPLHPLNGINEEPAQSRSALFTPIYGPTAPAVPGGTAVVLFPFPLATPGLDLTATVAEVLPAGSPVPIPPGGAVLIATGAAAAPLAAEAVPGTEVTVRLDLRPDWPGLVTATGGGPLLVRDGRPVTTTTEWFTRTQLVPRAPRSAIGQRADGRLLLVAVDGRRPGYSAGLTNADLARTLVRLGAVTAMALDSGGSTTIAVDGVVLNRPSDGTERPVGSALVFRYEGAFLPPPRPLVSPDGDGVDDEQILGVRLTRPSTVTVELRRPDGTVASNDSGERAPGLHPVVFPPAPDASAPGPVAEGRWQLSVSATDDIGRTTAMRRSFVVNSTLGYVRTDRRLLRLAPKGTPLTVRWRLARDAGVRVSIERVGGPPVATFAVRRYGPGDHAVTWNGLVRGRVRAPAGSYVARVRAANALGVVEHAVPVRVIHLAR